MTTSSFLRDIKKSLSPKAIEFFERLEQRPEVQRVLTADENEQLAARRAQIVRLSQIPGEFEKASVAAAKRLADIQKRRAAAELQLRALREDEVAAQQTSSGLQYLSEGAVAKVQNELIANCDPRITAAITLLSDLAMNHLRNAVRVEALAKGKVVSNLADVAAASEAVSQAIATCLEYRMQALSARDVELKLSALFAELREPLAALNLGAPFIEDGIVKRAGASALAVQGASA